MQSRQQVTGLVWSRDDITGLAAPRAQKLDFTVKLQLGSGAGGGAGGAGEGGVGGLNGLWPLAKKGTARPCSDRFGLAPISSQLSIIGWQLPGVSPFHDGSTLFPAPSASHADAHLPAAAIIASARSNVAWASA